MKKKTGIKAKVDIKRKTVALAKKSSAGTKGSAGSTEKKKKMASHSQVTKSDTKKIKTVKPKYEIDSFVVYPMHGVGKITDIRKETVLKVKQDYYIIELEATKMRVKIPVASADEVGLRSIIDKRSINKVLNLLKKDVVEVEEDWKIRYQNNLDKIKSGSIYEVSEVCRNLYKRAKDKELSIMERKLYETAYNLIITEIAICKGIELEDAGNLISEILSL